MEENETGLCQARDLRGIHKGTRVWGNAPDALAWMLGEA